MRVNLFCGLLLLLSPSGTPPVARVFRCSLIYTLIPRSESTVWFLGNALPDTMDAGPGATVVVGQGPGHSSRGETGAFRGQLVQVERLEPRAAKVLDRALQESSGRMVLVPWDYDASCATLPYSARADWNPPGTPGLYHGVLRPKQFWAGKLPTLDVFTPEAVPYPFRRGFRSLGDPSSRLATAEQVFEFVASAPASKPGSSFKNMEGVNRWMRTWARDHPALAGLSPLAEEISRNRSIDLHERASFHRIKSPIAGTWRVEVALARDTFRFFARTTETPVSAQYDSVGVFEYPDDAPTLPPLSYDLYTRFTRDPGMLDSLFAIGDSGAVAGYFELVTRPLFQSRDSTVWRGSLPVPRIAQQLFAPISSGLFMEYLKAQRTRDSSVLGTLRTRGLSPLWHDLYVADSLRMADRFSKRDGARYQGRFVLSRNGQLRGEEKLLIGGALLLTVRAERISDQRYRGELLPRTRADLPGSHRQ